MTYYYFQSKDISNAEAVYRFKELLKQGGWTINSSGTGTSGTYNASGDNLLSAANIGTRSWYVASHPNLDGYQRYICFQANSASATQFRIKMGWAPFSGGSPSANTVPSSTDEQVLIGTGTDASPTFATLFVTNPNSFYMSVGDVTEKYSFYLCSIYGSSGALSTPITQSIFTMQRLVDASPFDIDPYIYDCNPTPLTAGWSSGSTTPTLRAWYRKGLSGATFSTYSIGTYGGSTVSGTTFLNKVGIDPYTGSIYLLPLMVARNTPNQGYKGIFRDFKLSIKSCAHGYSISDVNPGDRIVIMENIAINHSGLPPII